MPASHPARLKMPVYDVARGRWYENDFHKSRVDMQTLVTRMNSRVTQPSEYVEFDQAVLARMAAGAGGPFPPKYSTIVAKAVSEDASQMACVLVTEHYDPVFWQLKRIAPRLRLPHHTDGDLWVSKPDGANLQMVGTLIANVHISLDTPIKSVQWTPDNGKVSFVYEGALYLAPVK
jgi:hypothetical protein